MAIRFTNAYDTIATMPKNNWYKIILARPFERLMRRIWASLNYIFYKRKTSPIFILASARTGSTLLETYLASHPDLNTVGEIINPNIVRGLRKELVSRAEFFFHIRASINMGKSKFSGRPVSLEVI